MSLSTQFITMLAMIGMGSYFGASLDTYNRFLQREKRRKWVVFIHDVLFWVSQGLSIFYVLFMVNQGELRFYIFLALLCGYAAYESLFKKMYLWLLETIIKICVKTYQFLVKTFNILIYKPVKYILHLLLTIVLYLGKGLLSLVRFITGILLWILKRLIFLPLKWIGKICWNLLSKRMKKHLLTIYNKVAGFFRKVKNRLIYTISMWKKK